jgi:O-antigen/teichoic acid export membrane protein
VTINIVANYKDDRQRDAIVLEFEKLALVISVLMLLFAVLFRDQLQQFLQFESATPIVLLMIALVATVPFTFRGAFLRGKQKFALASIANILAAGSKLIFAVVFIAIGWGAAGAIGGLVCAQILASLYAARYAYRFGLRKPKDHSWLRLPSMHILRPELAYGALVLVGSFVITFQYSIDVVVVKHFFDPHIAGLYAGVASVARILFFLTASIALVLMPMVRLDKPAAENRRLLIKSLLLCVALSGPVLLIFMFMPESTVHLLMGTGFESVADLLPRLSFAIFIISILNLFVSYYLALRRFWLAIVAIIGGVTTYGLMLANHASLTAVVNNLLLGSVVMFAALGIWVAGQKVKEYL